MFCIVTTHSDCIDITDTFDNIYPVYSEATAYKYPEDRNQSLAFSTLTAK